MKRHFNYFRLFLLFGLSLLFISTQSSAAQAAERIHFITMNKGHSDAIILESDGHFGMIDVGEDPSFPDGTDERYPVRPITTTDPEISVQDRLFMHLEEIGAEKLDFVILTHAHSDHMGNAHDLFDHLPVDRIYVKEYSDDKITSENNLWDNQYVYDRAIESAHRNGVQIIQPITEQDAQFNFGNMHLQLYNYEYERHADGSPVTYYDDNLNSIVTVIEWQGRRIYLGGDLQNNTGKEDDYAPLIGTVDLMKLNHHTGTDFGDHSSTFIDQLNPRIAVATVGWPIDGITNKLAAKGIDTYSTAYKDRKAIVFDLERNFAEVSTEYTHYGVTQSGQNNIFIDYKGEQITDPGWLYNGDVYYYIMPTGFLAEGLTPVDQGAYYFDEHNKLQTGWIRDKNKWYYADAGGLIKTGWQRINNAWYYLGTDGAMRTRWLKLGYSWYYLQPNGEMITDTHKINGKHYFFNADGSMQTGWQKHEDSWVYLTPSGIARTGWMKSGRDWYYFNADGVGRTGWLKSGSAWYYIRGGLMTTGWQKAGNTWYFLNVDGTMRGGGWFKQGSTWYHLQSSGAMSTGWRRVGGKWYYMNSSGAMRGGGWFKQGDTWYHLQSSGAMSTGWQRVNGKWYYMNASGAMQTGWRYVGGKWYYMNASGAMQTGWLELDEDTYYLSQSGAMLTGATQIDSTTYIFNEISGRLESSLSE